MLALMAAFVVAAGPLSTVPLARIDAFVPMYVAAMFVSDGITAVLLFAQFAILRSHALLAIASGYLFTALIVIPYGLTFPGAFAPEGLLGAGLQSPPWLYFLWHVGFPLSVTAYALLKNADPSKQRWKGTLTTASLLSAAVVVAAVCAATLLVTAGHALLPRLLRDTVSSAGPLYQSSAARIVLVNAVVALMVLWIRRGSVLDLWLMVVLCDYVIEISLFMIPVVVNRYSFGWYAGRFFGLISGTLVLFVLLYEITTLYARLVNAILSQRREREARLMTGDAVSASIAHEVNQPLSAMIANADAGLNWLTRAVPDLEEAKAAFTHIAADGHRAGAVIAGTRAMFKKDVRARTTLDVNEIIRGVLAAVHDELERHRVSVRVELTDSLPWVNGDRVQLQQVLLNLTTNAIESMATADGARALGVTSEIHTSGGVLVSVKDTGTGVAPEDVDRIFAPLFTTKSHGMGMGLSISRSIIEAHDGRLWSAPNAPRGSVFHFVLPADTAMAAGRQAARHAGAGR
ncbi:MAG: two-component sensor histidine kinase [Candidatus Rokubacteria bacterium 13_1_40CM_4_67_11]|nr:MAG: two-component sensor histidine kinase [Candidatus Rokubacteria bacterium 13_1_40CM_4_67_11]